MRFALLVLALLFSLPGSAYDSEVAVGARFEHVDLHPYLIYLRSDQQQQFSTVRQLPGWRSSVNESPLNPGEALWGQFSLQQQSNQPMRLVLMLGNANLDLVDIYILDNLGRIRQSVHMGAERAIETRPLNHRNFVLPIETKPGEKLTVFFRLQDQGPMVFPIELWRSEELVAKEQRYLFIVGIIAGALAILASYFLITYVLLQSPVRFWFAMSAILFLLLYLNVEGVLAQLLPISAYLPHITTALVAMAMFTGTKASYYMTVNMPRLFKQVNYALCATLLVASLLFNDYQQLILAAFGGALLVLLQLLQTFIYRNKINSLPNRIYGIGWFTLTATAVIQTLMFLNGELLDIHTSQSLAFLGLAGVLFQAIAVESHEQVLTSDQQQRQTQTINSLRYFYNLFRNSAEGLYTSTLNGELISTNPAMSSLFGYESEKQILEEVQNTAEFYADENDRQLLLLEIEEHGVILGREIKGKRRDGSEFWFSLSVQLQEEDGRKFMYGSVFDVDERKRSSLSLEYLATHDSLTGVFNRRHFEQGLNQSLADARRHQTELTLLYMDLDQFKVVNDTCGHKAGDVLIKQLAQQLNDVVQDKGMLARLGGDEFGVLLTGDNAELAYTLANRLLNVVQDFRFVWENHIFSLGISIGLVPYQAYMQNSDQLLSMADAACYMAKEQGRNQIHTYSRDDESIKRYETELRWLGLINQALEHDNFELYYQHYQPLDQVSSGHHYEILLRLQNDDEQMLPGTFLRAAERFNLTAAIDKWVVEHYFRWLSEQPAHKQELIRCNINLSGHSLADKELKLFVLNAFEKYSIPYDKICFEITESQAIIKLDETLNFIRTFHKLGCKFALDDFGSGFSSYGYLKKLPVDYVKIDGSFVKDILNDPVDMAMVRSISDVATAMGIRSVAEFVESKAIMIELAKIGVDYAQGFGIAEPMPLQQFSPYQQKEA